MVGSVVNSVTGRATKGVTVVGVADVAIAMFGVGGARVNAGPVEFQASEAQKSGIFPEEIRKECQNGIVMKICQRRIFGVGCQALAR